MSIEIVKYNDQFQIGVSFAVHSHGFKSHKHFWLDLGRRCLEVTFGGEEGE